VVEDSVDESRVSVSVRRLTAYLRQPAHGAKPGHADMVLATIVGDAIYSMTGRKIPAVCWVSIVAMFMTSPLCPWASQISTYSAQNDFLGITSPMLTFAGLSIAKDIPAFRRLGWRIVLVSFVADAGTFLGATLVAQLFHVSDINVSIAPAYSCWCFGANETFIVPGVSGRRRFQSTSGAATPPD
jgi:hypothetical protein